MSNKVLKSMILASILLGNSTVIKASISFDDVCKKTNDILGKVSKKVILSAAGVGVAGLYLIASRINNKNVFDLTHTVDGLFAKNNDGFLIIQKLPNMDKELLQVSFSNKNKFNITSKTHNNHTLILTSDDSNDKNVYLLDLKTRRIYKMVNGKAVYNLSLNNKSKAFCVLNKFHNVKKTAEAHERIKNSFKNKSLVLANFIVKHPSTHAVGAAIATVAATYLVNKTVSDKFYLNNICGVASFGAGSAGTMLLSKKAFDLVVEQKYNLKKN